MLREEPKLSENVMLAKETMLADIREQIEKADGKIVEGTVQYIVEKYPYAPYRFDGIGMIAVRCEADVPVGYCDPSNQSAG